MFPIKYSTDGRTWPKLLFSAASDIAHKPKKNIQNCGRTEEKTEKTFEIAHKPKKNIRNCTEINTRNNRKKTFKIAHKQKKKQEKHHLKLHTNRRKNKKKHPKLHINQRQT
jgi:hypothetical protein